MTSVLLIYPYFLRARDRSVFRFPPLGISYVAAAVRQAGHDVRLLDCTFLKRAAAAHTAIEAGAEAVGMYCMVTMLKDCLWFARLLRPHSKLLVVGGPSPTCDPSPFLQDFDVVVRGEAEQTMVDILRGYEKGSELGHIAGTVVGARQPPSESPAAGGSSTAHAHEENLDRIAFPARDLLPNQDYIRHGRQKYGYSVTTIMSTRGCPYDCEFCSNVVLGGSYRERCASSVVDEVEEALALGYDRISFADDVFTLNRRRVRQVCEEIVRRGLRFKWECLGRVDTLDYAVALEMKRAGCARIYFGIESGNNRILKLMKKKITVEQARAAVETAHAAGIEAGAFFILFYPGETDATVLDTLHFAASLPLDYVGLSMPYPIPGSALYERVRDQVSREWRPGESVLGDHVLTYHSEFSEAKMWLGIIKGHAEFRIRRRLGPLAPALLPLFEKPTDLLLRLTK